MRLGKSILIGTLLIIFSPLLACIIGILLIIMSVPMFLTCIWVVYKHWRRTILLLYLKYYYQYNSEMKVKVIEPENIILLRCGYNYWEINIGEHNLWTMLSYVISNIKSVNEHGSKLNKIQ